jgi:hypothetical protein
MSYGTDIPVMAKLRPTEYELNIALKEMENRSVSKKNMKYALAVVESARRADTIGRVSLEGVARLEEVFKTGEGKNVRVSSREEQG